MASQVSLEAVKRTRILCHRCRQRLTSVTPAVTTTVQCPACKSKNKIQTFEHLESHEQGNMLVAVNFAAKLKNMVSKPLSLNAKPSPLAASKLSSEERPRKRALLIGVIYKNWKYELKGTINDVKNMRKLLIERFGFQPKNILVLTEDETDQDLTPLKKNIQNSLKWLVDDCQHGDSLVFFFSGHGLRQPDFNNEESDGFNETICPVDFIKEGMIFDDEIFSTIVSPLPNGVTLHAIVDACHSGTVLDLSYVYNREQKTWEESGHKKPTSGGFAVSISACRDDQVAADTSAFTRDAMSGALTYILVDIVNKTPEITYGMLLDSIQKSIDEANQGCLPVRIFKRVFHQMLFQKPQLSATEHFDIYERPFIL